MALIENSKFKIPLPKDYFMSLLAGIESGLATTTAIIGGLTITSTSRQLVITTAVISMLVQAWNSAMSKISLENTEDQIDHPYSKTVHYLHYIGEGLAQFTAHVAAGLAPIIPIAVIADRATGLSASIVVTLLLLFLIGFNKGKILKRSKSRSAFEMVIPAALVICIGIVAGVALS